jgi:hypothetical protein
MTLYLDDYDQFGSSCLLICDVFRRTWWPPQQFCIHVMFVCQVFPKGHVHVSIMCLYSTSLAPTTECGAYRSIWHSIRKWLGVNDKCEHMSCWYFLRWMGCPIEPLSLPPIQNSPSQCYTAISRASQMAKYLDVKWLKSHSNDPHLGTISWNHHWKPHPNIIPIEENIPTHRVSSTEP